MGKPTYIVFLLCSQQGCFFVTLHIMVYELFNFKSDTLSKNLVLSLFLDGSIGTCSTCFTCLFCQIISINNCDESTFWCILHGRSNSNRGVPLTHIIWPWWFTTWLCRHCTTLCNTMLFNMTLSWLSQGCQHDQDEACFSFWLNNVWETSCVIISINNLLRWGM